MQRSSRKVINTWMIASKTFHSRRSCNCCTYSLLTPWVGTIKLWLIPFRAMLDAELESKRSWNWEWETYKPRSIYLAGIKPQPGPPHPHLIKLQTSRQHLNRISCLAQGWEVNQVSSSYWYFMPWEQMAFRCWLELSGSWMDGSEHTLQFHYDFSFCIGIGSPPFQQRLCAL